MMVDLDADAHQYRLDEIQELKTDIARLKENCYEQYKRIEELEQTLLQEYERSRHYQTALSNISKMSMCMATSYMDLAQKQKDLAYEALEFK